MKRILVTGGAGYIGSVLCRRLLEDGYQVRAIDNLRFGDEGVEEIKKDKGFELFVGDIRKEEDLKSALKDIFGVVHLAAIVGDPNCAKEPQLAQETNRDASQLLLKLAQESGAERFVFASTCSNYGKMLNNEGFVNEQTELRPVSLYAKLKVEFENHVMSQDYKDNFTATCLRFSTAYGLSPRMRYDLTVNEFTKELVEGNELVVFGEQFWRPYCHIYDLSRACIAVLEADPEKVHKDVFNVGDTKENYQKQTLVNLLEERIDGAKVKYVKKDEDPRDYRVNTDKIKNILDYQISKTVPDGMDEIIQHLNQQTAQAGS